MRVSARAAAVAPLLLRWYDAQRRDLPWRAPPGKPADPYKVWLSEVMLQQTTTQTVRGYYDAFLRRWPTVAALAAAPQEAVLAAWAGLGYYARARNLHRCARVIAETRGGRFPDDEASLRALPGIGRYTAAAIAAIAWDRPAVVVDGNVERVMARLFACATPLPLAREELFARAAACAPQQRAGDYAQATMDLGATVCTPRAPRCDLCPVQSLCLGRDDAETLPRRLAKPQKPTRYGVAFWLETETGLVLLCRRPQRGLLGGMAALPGSDWSAAEPLTADAARQLAPVPISGLRLLAGVVRHTFTHFHLQLQVMVAALPPRVAAALPADHFLVPRSDLADQGLPTVMKKAVMVASETLRAEFQRTG